ncbi:MAG: hypothetical protein R3D28_20710 [Geminicoccaceae bacterium]
MPHLDAFGLAGFTGCVCITLLSMEVLRLLKAGDQAAAAPALGGDPAARVGCASASSPIRVLHEAVRLAGVAETGPILPAALSNLEAEHHPAILAALVAGWRPSRALRPATALAG